MDSSESIENEKGKPPQALSHLLHIGTSSWGCKEWRNVFYPDSVTTADQLAYFAGRFNTVEVNSSFYALPTPDTLIDWVEQVPPGFTFSLKVPKEISHSKRLVDCRADMLAYLDAVRSLGSLAAPGLLQLPPDFTRANGGRALVDFLDWLPGVMDHLKLSVEVRALELMTPAFAQFLAERGFTFVVTVQDGVPDLFPVWQALMAAENGPRTCFVRWSGNQDREAADNRTLTNTPLTNPRDAELALWASRIEWLVERQIECFGYMHNSFEGHAPGSVRRLFQHLAPLVSLPQWPPEGWSPPHKEDDGKEDDQLSLFEE